MPRNQEVLSVPAKMLKTNIDEDPVITGTEDMPFQERNMTMRRAIRLYPAGVFWGFVMCTTIIMEGYDVKLMGNLFASPAFRKAFGESVAHQENIYEISAPWQAGLSNGAGIGQFCGVLISGYLVERFGFRKTMIGGLLCISAFLFLPFFSTSLPMLLVGQILFGIPLGLFQTAAVVYAFEVTPLQLRAYLTNYVHLCWAIGGLIVTGVFRAFLHRTDHWAFRAPFAIQWIWPIVLLPAIVLAPESPQWLTRVGRIEEARRVLRRLTSRKHTEFDVDKAVEFMIMTNEHESTTGHGGTYAACFKGTNLRRTISIMGIYCIQTLSGNPLRGYATYFFQQTGMPTTWSFNLTLISYAVAIAGGCLSWAVLPLAGRRSIYLWNLVAMVFIMLLIGGLGIPQATREHSPYSWPIGVLLTISNFVYFYSIGPLTNTLCVEIPSAMLRSKSIALARLAYVISAIIGSVLTPYQLSSTAWNWKAKTGFFWAGCCIISVVFVFYMVPEPKDRTTVELDILFEKGVRPRDFAKTTVNLTEMKPLSRSSDIRI